MSIEVNQNIWRAVVGPSVEIPAVNSYVYYFPQGHLESSSVHGDYNYQGFPSIPCRVLSLRFLGNSSSDEYFVKISLLPLQAAELWYIQKYMNENNEENDNNNDQTDVIASFLKVLTPSDANINGKGGFSVTKYYANEIFPKLNISDDPHPAQSLSIRDAHNNAWEFRHIYRGAPPRHLLTTGWSKFVDIKRLAAGDSVVFMKKMSTEELFIGIRRDHARLGGDEINNRIHAALDAVQRAMTGLVFEVDCYPRLGFPEFVVSGARVDRSLRIQWREDMRVKMAAPATDDPGRITCFEGKIESVNSRNNSGQWPQSPWRMLQVSWDEPGVHPNLKKVSPWGVVECERPSSSSQLSSALPPCKKLKLSQNPAEILPDDDGDHDGEFSFPNLIETHLNSAPSFQYPPFPSTLEFDDSNHQSFTELLKSGMEKEHETVSTVLSIGRSICEPSSTNVEQGQNSSRGDGGRSFVLFGKIIQPAENPTEVGGSRDNGGFSDGDRYVSENVQPNSSLGFNNNNKGKNVFYE